MGTVYDGPKWTVSALYEALLKEEMDAAASRHPAVAYRPTLIDAAYAGILTASADGPLVTPALNRDGDCLSDLVLALFGSIAGAESVLLAFDDELVPTVAMAQAPHGTVPSLAGKNVADAVIVRLSHPQGAWCALPLGRPPPRGLRHVRDRCRISAESRSGVARHRSAQGRPRGGRHRTLGTAVLVPGEQDEIDHEEPDEQGRRCHPKRWAEGEEESSAGNPQRYEGPREPPAP